MVESGENNGAVFTLTVTEDKLQVRLSCPAAAAQAVTLLEDIERESARRGIKVAPARESLREALRRAAETGENIDEIVVAQGRAPQPPKDGFLEWTASYFTSGFVVDAETKRIDFRQKAENLTVEKGQLLVRVHPPRDGRDGEDVYGRPIKTTRAKVAAIRPGRQVTWDEKEQGYRAGCAGRLRFTGATLEVDNVFHIKGNVDSTTGNVKHNGQLIVDGNIEPDSKVECTGDIDVHGLIYASDIDCGGTLVVRSGINQGPAKRMQVTGDVVAKYIHNASLEAIGNIHVETEVFQSQIRSTGEIICQNGRIVGGETVAAADITVGEVGSRGNVKTMLVAGLHYELMKRLQANTAVIKKCMETIRTMTSAYKQAMANPTLLSAAQREGAMEMEFAITEAQEKIAELEKQNQDLSREAYAGRKARIRIMGVVHPGAVLRIYNAQHIVEDALVGPLAAALDPVTGEVTLTSETEPIMETKHES
jgi:uncharacterized protein